MGMARGNGHGARYMCMAAPAIETKIWLALRKRLEEFPTSVPIAWPGVAFTPTSKYVRVGFSIIPPERRLIKAGPHDRKGVFSLTPCGVLSTEGESLLELAGQLADHFPVDVPFCYMDACVCVIAEPHVVGGYQDKGFWNVPVTINWQCFA